METLERIESLANSKIKLAAKLHSRKYRREENLFVAEGVRLVEMAANAEWPMEFALASEEVLKNDRAVEVIELLQSKGCPVYEVSQELYNKAADTVSPQGLMLVMGQRIFTWQEVFSSSDGSAPLVAVLDGIQDPGNAGTIIRTADALGCTGVVCLNNTTDLYADKTVRSSMGSLFNLPIMDNVSANNLQEVCHENGVNIIATALDEHAFCHLLADYVSPVAIVFGNEGNGVSVEVLNNASQKVYIPMLGKAESLNVAAAAAIVLYEACRQRAII